MYINILKQLTVLKSASLILEVDKLFKYIHLHVYIIIFIYSWVRLYL